MGGCRCSYRNCTLRTDGKTHMFHYPVFDKVRCHQWLTNARKLEFLNLKVSQLKNRVVCQHHFKDENFMNFKKDKLTHDAVPTEDGPYCDSSQSDINKTKNEDTKVFSISLDDIEDEYLTIVDKKANFSVKYGDFLTNCDLMDLDALNQIDDNNQVNVHTISVFDSHVPKEQVSSNIPVRSITRNMTKRKRNYIANNTILKDTTTRNNTLNQDNIATHYISKNNETQQKIEDQSSTNLTLTISQIPVEFDVTKPDTQNQIPVELVKTISNAQKPDMPFVFVDSISSDHKQQDWQQPQAVDFKEFQQSKPLNENNNKSVLNERKKIRIISEKKQILEPVPVGKLEPVSPNRILTLPIIRKTNPKPLQVIPEVVNNSINENPNEELGKFKDDFVVKKSESQPVGTNHISATTEYKKTVSERNESNVLNKSLHEGSLNTSLIKNKIPPERVAAIAEKRKFNMKLRDIIEDCLDKLDEPDKIDNVKRKTHKSRTVPTKNLKIGHETKETELPEVQKYTIAYLEARMKKMENNLLSKIDENSQKIQDLKQTCTIDMIKAVHKKKSVQTQTSVSEDVHKKQLYQELSKYLSQEANSLIYEELFINKFTQQVPMSLSPTKRRKRR